MLSLLRRGSIHCLVVAACWWSGIAHAHDLTGEIGLQAGLMHPLTGLDHLLAMVAVGMVSVELGGHALWRVPGLFLLAMAVGATTGYAGWRIPAH
jgi:urease accessory protein